MEVLDLVRIICKRNSIDHASYSDAELVKMNSLKQQMQRAVGEEGTFHDISDAPLTREDMLAYLYRSAALIYLNRAVLHASGAASSFQHLRLVREGILVLRSLGSCDAGWPLFVLACEAAADEQRLQILDVFARTAQEPSYRSSRLHLVRQLVESIWKQHDLNVASNVDYLTTLHAVISTTPSLPLFV